MVVFWGVEVKPGKPYLHTPDGDHGSQLHLSQATLGLNGKPQQRVLLSVTVENTTPAEILVCSLTAGSVDSCPLDLIFDTEVVFKVKGSTSIHLTGYYMPIDLHSQDSDEDGMFEADDDDFSGSEEFEDDDEREDDDELDEDEYDSADEDMMDEPVVGRKKSGVVIEEVGEEEAAATPPPRLTYPAAEQADEKETDKKETDKKEAAKKEGKKKDKKAATQNGTGTAAKADKAASDAATAGGATEEDEDGFLVSGKRPAADAAAAEKPKKKQAVASAGDSPAAAAVASSEGAPEQAKEKEPEAQPPTAAAGKKAKGKKGEKAAAAAAAAATAATEKAPAGGKIPAAETGAAPAEAAEPPPVAASAKAEPKKVKGKKGQAEGSAQGSAPGGKGEEGSEPVAVKAEAKAKAKAEKKTAVIEGQKEGGKSAAVAEVKTPEAKPAKSRSATPVVRRYPNGLEVQEVALGKPSGKQAVPGKRIFMHYTGRLKNNGKQFDSSIGKKPFSFRLGVGEVIKGWDVGVQGMRVGDKRKLIIPPQMGYGAQGVPGTIPGNSWLQFDVELVDVK